MWNVIKTVINLVGPSPLLMQFLSRYSSELAKRHNVKLGITGWVQVNGCNAISLEQKFKLDVEYVEKRSFSLNLML